MAFLKVNFCSLLSRLLHCPNRISMNPLLKRREASPAPPGANLSGEPLGEAAREVGGGRSLCCKGGTRGRRLSAPDGARWRQMEGTGASTAGDRRMPLPMPIASPTRAGAFRGAFPTQLVPTFPFPTKSLRTRLLFVCSDLFASISSCLDSSFPPSSHGCISHGRSESCAEEIRAEISRDRRECEKFIGNQNRKRFHRRHFGISTDR